MTPIEHQVCYCTNVHSGRTIDDILARLDEHAVAVRDSVRPGAELGIGLWLSDACARELLHERGGVERFAREIESRRLRVITMNGFPQKDFHAPVVKHDVYRPSWADPARLVYSLDLAHVLSEILEEGAQGSISTLPLGWRGDGVDRRACAEHLAALADHLAAILRETGRHITVDLEPEPGCELDLSEHVVAFMEDDLIPAGDEAAIRAHIGVCHDVCHAAVMREGQRESLERYEAAGISVNKVQVSSALRVAPGGHGALRSFAEERYLHQTTVAAGGEVAFYEDLAPAMEAIQHAPAFEEARVHFHVPIDRAVIDRDNGLVTTSEEIPQAIRAARDLFPLAVFEVETYTWGVLDPTLRPASLAEGIASEIAFLDAVLEEVTS